MPIVEAGPPCAPFIKPAEAPTTPCCWRAPGSSRGDFRPETLPATPTAHLNKLCEYLETDLKVPSTPRTLTRISENLLSAIELTASVEAYPQRLSALVSTYCRRLLTSQDISVSEAQAELLRIAASHRLAGHAANFQRELANLSLSLRPQHAEGARAAEGVQRELQQPGYALLLEGARLRYPAAHAAFDSFETVQNEFLNAPDNSTLGLYQVQTVRSLEQALHAGVPMAVLYDLYSLIPVQFRHRDCTRVLFSLDRWKGLRTNQLEQLYRRNELSDEIQIDIIDEILRRPLENDALRSFLSRLQPDDLELALDQIGKMSDPQRAFTVLRAVHEISTDPEHSDSFDNKFRALALIAQLRWESAREFVLPHVEHELQLIARMTSPTLTDLDKIKSLLEALAQSNDLGSLQALGQIIKDPAVSIHAKTVAATALGESKSTAVVPLIDAIIQSTTTSPDVYLELRCVQAKMGHAQAADDLLRRLPTQSKYQRRTILESIVMGIRDSASCERVVAPCLEFSEHDQLAFYYREALERALTSLTAQGPTARQTFSQKIEQLFTEHIQDGYGLPKDLARWIEPVATPASCDALALIAENGELEGPTRIAAVRTMARTPQGRSKLLAYIRGENVTLAEVALRSAAEFGRAQETPLHDEFWRAVMDAAGTLAVSPDHPPTTRRIAIHTIGQLPHPSTTPKLTDLLALCQEAEGSGVFSPETAAEVWNYLMQELAIRGSPLAVQYVQEKLINSGTTTPAELWSVLSKLPFEQFCAALGIEPRERLGFLESSAPASAADKYLRHVLILEARRDLPPR